MLGGPWSARLNSGKTLDHNITPGIFLIFYLNILFLFDFFVFLQIGMNMGVKGYCSPFPRRRENNKKGIKRV